MRSLGIVGVIRQVLTSGAGRKLAGLWLANSEQVVSWLACLGVELMKLVFELQRIVSLLVAKSKND